MTNCLSFVTSLLVFSSVALQAQTTAPSATPRHSDPAQGSPQSVAAQEDYGKLPLSFEANQGQVDPQVKFTSRGSGYSLFLTDSAAVLSLTKENAPSGKGGHRSPAAKAVATSGKTDVVRMELAGASHGLRVEGAEKLPGVANYFIGNDSSKWHNSVPTYGKVKYSGVYPGVDLVYYGTQRQLEYDFILAPDADSKPVKLHFAGAEKLTLNATGDLTVSAANGQIIFHKPVIYQMRDGQREPVDGRFSLLAKNTVGFNLGSYDHSRQVVIDPVLAYSTYLGGNGVSGESPAGIAINSYGEAYIAGTTGSYNFPVTRNGYQQVNNTSGESYTLFVTELNRAATAVIYSTYLGGSGSDYATGIALDSGGDAYVTGFTQSTDFPVTPGAFQQTGGSEPYSAFVTKLNPTGSGLVYSTYFAPSYTEASGIAVDRLGHAYIAGETDAMNFPLTSHAFQNETTEGLVGFVTKFSIDGSSLIYSTYLEPTSGSDTAVTSIALDSAGDAYLTGYTDSASFPVTPGVFEPLPPATLSSTGRIIGFVSELNPTGSALVYSSYLGGSGYEYPYTIAVDSSGSAYVAGATQSTDFPTTAGSLQPTSDGGVAASGWDLAFITKVNPGGKTLGYSTYLGGAMTDADIGATAIAVDQAGDAFVTGYAVSGASHFPVTPDAFQPVDIGSRRGPTSFVSELNSSGSELLYSTFLGGTTGTGFANAIALDALDNVYVAGETSSQTFPVTPGAFQQKNGQTKSNGTATGNAFITKFAFNGITTTTVASDVNPQIAGTPVTFTAYTVPATGSDVPVGQVGFDIDGVNVAHVSLDETGHAVYTSTLVAGSHNVVAYYLGDPKNYSASTGVLTETINGPAVAPTFNPLGGTHNGPIKVQIETTSAGATIHYTTDGTTPNMNSTVYANKISISQPSTTIKAIAVESGDTQSPVSTAVFTIVPTAVATTTSLQSSPNPSVEGQSITLTARVTAASGAAPTGSVTFKHYITELGSAPLVNGVATFTTSSLPPGTYNLLAVYTGDATHNSSTTPAPVMQKVNP